MSNIVDKILDNIIFNGIRKFPISDMCLLCEAFLNNKTY
jgi:hypothetical protein